MSQDYRSCPFPWTVNNSWLCKTSPGDLCMLAVGGQSLHVCMQNSEFGARQDPPDSDFLPAKTGGDHGHMKVT